MSTVPNPAHEAIEVADGRLVYTCCGKLDDAPHKSLCEHFRDDHGFSERFLERQRMTKAERLVEDAARRWGYAPRGEL